MKSAELKENMAVKTIDSALRRENRAKGSKQGVIVNPSVVKNGTVPTVLVQFEKETEARYVPIVRLEVA